jgi:Cu-Zn family superoxide dismutase
MKTPFVPLVRSAAVATAATALLAGCSMMGWSDGPGAMARLQSKSGSNVSGTVRFAQVSGGVHITGTVSGNTPGPKGFHIHEKGDCSSADGMSAGGHFNPAKVQHGPPGHGHAGDFGNIVFDQSGNATLDMTMTGVTLDNNPATGIIGRAVVIHAMTDDMRTDPTGNAGGRVACGIIE